MIIMDGGFLGNACERGQGTAERELHMYVHHTYDTARHGTRLDVDGRPRGATAAENNVPLNTL